jgi:polysaccharide export outer membrane protein
LKSSLVKFCSVIKPAVFLLGLLMVTSASGQSRQPTQDQLRMLQQMSPAERQLVIETLSGSSSVGNDQSVEFPNLVNPIELDEGPELELTIDEAKLALSFFERDILLESFGYDLFAGVPTTFAPATDIPVPPEYKLGPGDSIDVQLFGKENRQYSLVVNRDGTINFPDIGPINVIGLDFQELKQQLLDRISDGLIGTSAAISMGALRSIRIFVLGDARRPGSFTVSGLSTMTNALFLSGGVNEIGSLRNIQLKRNGKLIQTLDLYDLLINGDTSTDARLQSGDVIFVPPIGPTVGVGGFVKRPAIYELRKEKTAGEIITLAGGFTSDAFPGGARVERITKEWERAFLNVNLSTDEGQKNLLRPGDILLVPPVLARYKGGVRVSGHVLRPGDFEWREGLRLTDVIESLDELRPQADINYVLIRRETWPDKRVKALSANLQAALENPESEDNIFLRPRDVIRVFDLESERAGTDADILQATDIQRLANELKLQATAEKPLEIVTVGGRVRAPGNYPFEDGMRLDDLIRAGANLSEGAYTTEAELSRFEVINGTVRRTRIIKVNPVAALANEDDANILLQPYDSLQIREIQEWREQLSILIEGEVRFPGRYSFNTGDTLASVIERAGGLTDQAFAQGGVFLRQALKEREQKQLQELASKIESDLAALAVMASNEMDADAVEAQSAGTALLTKLRNTVATGRLVINLPAMIKNPGDLETMVLLKQNDKLMIPAVTQSVTVLGEVQFPTSHLFSANLNRDEYIGRSGGITQNAAKKQIYVVRANGAVLAGNQSGWFNSGRRIRVEPGDTIVVPLDTRRVSKLRLWADVTQVVFNLALAAAAVNSF